MSPGAISCADQIFSNSVVGVMTGAVRPTRWPAGRPPPLSGWRSDGAGRRRRSRSPRCRARARRRRRASVSAPCSSTAVSRAPGSWRGGSPGPPVTAPARERVARDLGPQPGQRRRQHLVGVADRPAAATFAAAHDGHHALLVEAQELRQPQLEPRRDPARDLQRRARLAALDLAEHRRRDAGALREVAQREVHRLPQRLHARPDGRDGGVCSRRHYACTLSRTCVSCANRT